MFYLHMKRTFSAGYYSNGQTAGNIGILFFHFNIKITKYLHVLREDNTS